MKIERIAIFCVEIPFTQQVSISKGSRSAASNLFIKIETTDGICGWGEGSPYPSLTGETQAGCLAAAKLFAPTLIGRPVAEIDAHLHVFRRLFRGHNSTKAAFDMAFYDILGQAARLPLFRFLGGERRELRTDYTIGILATVEETAAEAKLALSLDFETIKLKTGRPGLEDLIHVETVRKVIGKSKKLRIDSNQGWDFSNASRNIEEMRAYNLEFCEQPLPYWDIEGLTRLRHFSNLPIAADESVFDSHDATNIIRAGAADIINIKLGKSGGVHEALKIEAIATASGVTLMVGCFGETRLGLTAAAHFAMARSNVKFIDLDSSLIHAIDPVVGGMKFDPSTGGILHISEDAGLGASIDEEQVRSALWAEF